jgi:ribose transport system ATP-binding protein
MNDTIIKIESVSKEFSGVRVLDKINVEIKRGEVFGIVGENGAGKSTLMKILSGVYHPTEGSLFIQNQRFNLIKDTSTAKRLGISMIPQEFNLIDTLNVFENIFLGNEIKNEFLLNKKEMKERSKMYLKELNTEIKPEAELMDLSVAQKQMVEIAKALVIESNILIMDEPTTVLTGYEVDILFKLIQKIKENGVTVIFISHKIKEVKRICDRVMVLRDGKLITVDNIEDIEEEQIVQKMVGRELSQVFPAKTVPEEREVLRVDNLSIHGLLNDVSFNLKKGEILGFAGLVGAGRTETMEAVFGIRKRDSGKIYVEGKQHRIKTPADAVRLNIGYISEDRQGKGILVNFDIPRNITLISLKKYLSMILINRRKERLKTDEYIDKFNINAASLLSELQFLSGGNQQKVYIAKWMDTSPEILILDEPTRGIDVNAKREIYHFMNNLSKQGISIILISSELEEIIGMCSRVYVMREGSITGILEGKDLNEEEIMYYATGLKRGNDIYE